MDSFGTLLNSEFGIGTSDSGILSRIADAFVTVPGLHYTTPRRVVYTTEDTLYYQLSDSRVAKVTADKIEVVDNGTDGMLFLLGQVNPIVHKLVHKKTDKPRWIEVLEQTSIQAMEGMTLEETHILLACMFYLNPWFKRWRGLMLPIEFAVAEPNSGKSFMYNLRLAILTGRPTLQHGPSTVRDWHADLTSTPAMWVGDNLGHLPNAMRNAMSDELARLVTDPSPSISMRKLYTTAENARLPVDCSFAMTAINNPFTREDLMQRSIIISLKAVPAGARDGRWYNREIENGGREAWLADHLVIAQKFLKEVSRGWDNDYLSNHRLVNFEQSLLVMSRVLGYGEEMPAIIGKLTHVVQENIAQFNPVIESLRAFVSHRAEVGLEREPFFASEMIDWAISSLDFAHVKVLQDARQLGKYMAGHAYDIEQSTGISKLEGRRDGKARYQIDMTKAEKFLDAS
ncbi:MAG: hypothetical protein LC687_01390 [Actinobacteria bacterium]|nr:hypothetical protein [Actinomycetota bacterium]